MKTWKTHDYGFLRGTLEARSVDCAPPCPQTEKLVRAIYANRPLTKEITVILFLVFLESARR